MQNRFFELDGKRFVIVSANGAGGRDLREQAELPFSRIREDLERMGTRFENILRIAVYMNNREIWDTVREVRQQIFRGEARPASCSAFVERFRPEGTRVEIEATALVVDREVGRRAIEFEPPRLFVKTLVAEQYAFLSGTTGEGQTVTEQAESCFKILAAYLHELGGSLLDLRRITIYLKRMDAMEEVSRVFQRLFTGRQPYWEVIPVSELVREEKLMEIEGTAVLAQRNS